MTNKRAKTETKTLEASFALDDPVVDPEDPVDALTVVVPVDALRPVVPVVLTPVVPLTAPVVPRGVPVVPEVPGVTAPVEETDPLETDPVVAAPPDDTTPDPLEVDELGVPGVTTNEAVLT